MAWNDESNPAQGFKYLYLTEGDYSELEEGTVNAVETIEGGEKRFALTDIIGQVGTFNNLVLIVVFRKYYCSRVLV